LILISTPKNTSEEREREREKDNLSGGWDALVWGWRLGVQAWKETAIFRERERAKWFSEGFLEKVEGVDYVMG